MIREDLRMLFFQRILDHLLSIALILLLMVMAIQSFKGGRKITEVIARVASQHNLRVDIHYTFALTGEWPRDSNSLLRTRPMGDPYSSVDGDVVMLEGGSINIRPTTGSIAGETISLRPAVPANNAAGPVSWVVGPGADDPTRLIPGDDATTLDPRWIPDCMR
jgi:hypothetical protein